MSLSVCLRACVCVNICIHTHTRTRIHTYIYNMYVCVCSVCVYSRPRILQCTDTGLNTRMLFKV